MNLDVLVLAPHPDDAELLCGGLLWKAKLAGKKIGVVDFTAGELGTRGTVEIRDLEAAAASKLIGLDVRENLHLRDGYLQDEDLLAAIVAVLRRHKPAWVAAPHWEDQHPDHAAVGQASIHACFMAGVPKYDPASGNDVASSAALPYRPKQLLHYNNRYLIEADLVLDVSDVFDRKMALVDCYQSQFGPGKEGADEPQTKLSHSHFQEWIRGVHSFYGSKIGVRYGEAYCLKGAGRLEVG